MMRVHVRREIWLSGGKYNGLRLEAGAELTDDDLDLTSRDPDDDRDPIDLALERALTAVNDCVAPELEAIRANNVADPPQWIDRVIKTIIVDQ